MFYHHKFHLPRCSYCIHKIVLMFRITNSNSHLISGNLSSKEPNLLTSLYCMARLEKMVRYSGYLLPELSLCSELQEEVFRKLQKHFKSISNC